MDRRKFMKQMSAGTAAFAVTATTPILSEAKALENKDHSNLKIEFKFDTFLYGASVYPELQSKEEQLNMLDLFQKANLTVLRVVESSWGNLETAPNVFDFAWLRTFLDEMHKRNMKAILGTSSYLPPQWLTAEHPEILWQFNEGFHANPMGRHAASRNHPLFRNHLEKFIVALGNEFKDHPAVTGWQLDNEIEWNILRVDYNPATRRAWTEWLKKTYHTIEEFNQRMGLNNWGLKANDFENVPQPSKSNDGAVPALFLANLHFDRDNIMEYFHWQKSLLRKAGVRHWITTDYVMIYETIADQPQATNPIDITGINQYQPTEDNPDHWASQAMYNNIHRCINNNGCFLVLETRIGPTGTTLIGNPAPLQEQFFMWMIHSAAFGANGILHWSGNRFNGGHWPHWGGMLDWSGHPEPDFYWCSEIASFFKKWGSHLISNKVDAKVAVFTDFDQRSALKIYPHYYSSNVLVETFDAFHRNGMGVDAINEDTAGHYENLKKYKIIVIAAATCLDAGKLNSALKQFVENGGTLIITPFTGYQTWDGIFQTTGFASQLSGLTGSVVRTVRAIGQPTVNKDKKNIAKWNTAMGLEASVIGINGYTEILEVQQGTEVIARFVTNEQVVNNLPAATLNKLGNGRVIKLAFWPADNNFTQLIFHLTHKSNLYLKKSLPAGVHGVTRTDGSLFLLNTLSKPCHVSLIKPAKDRISGKDIAANFELKRYQVLWLF